MPTLPDGDALTTLGPVVPLAQVPRGAPLAKADDDWDPDLHPRWPAGSTDGRGGEFAPKGEGTTGTAAGSTRSSGEALVTPVAYHTGSGASPATAAPSEALQPPPGRSWADWLNEEVPEYDQETGDQVGTQPRWRQLAPLGLIPAAVLLALAPELAGAGAAAEGLIAGGEAGGEIAGAAEGAGEFDAAAAIRNFLRRLVEDEKGSVPPEEEPPGIGDNRGPPLDDPPEIPPVRPPTSTERTAVRMAIAHWLEALSKIDPRTAATAITTLVRAYGWLKDYEADLESYLDPPKSLDDLKKGAGESKPGYQTHHIVEQTPARKDSIPDRTPEDPNNTIKIPESQIDSPENLVRIPKLKHDEISWWYSTPNPDPHYGGLSPRDYLRTKTWDERYQFGLNVLRDFGVLSP
jgi:hypothetical protein